MNITITIENPSAAVLKALGKAVPGSFSVAEALTDLIRCADEHAATTGHADHDEPAGYVQTYRVGDQVHWNGARFNFDGVIEKVDTDALESGDDNDKAVYVRRADTQKLVSLTNADIDTGGLTHLI